MNTDFTTTTKGVTKWSSYDRKRTIFQVHAYGLQHADCPIQECPFAVPGCIQYGGEVCSGGEMFAPISDYQCVKVGSPLFACEHKHITYFIGQGIGLGMKLYESDTIADINNARSRIFL